jgi:hypothetical protein
MNNKLPCKAKTAKQMREHEVPWPKTEQELTSYIDSLVNRDHDYGTCVYAMSCAALATFYYVSSKLGVTEFQASCADLDFLKRSRNMKNGFCVVDYNNLLYPQYLNDEHFPTFQTLMENNKEMLKKEAKKKLRGKDKFTSKTVIEHWKMLSKLKSDTP